MPRFFTQQIDPASGMAVIDGEDARHLSLSLRVKPGETLTVCDGNGIDYYGTISVVERERVLVNIMESCPSKGEPAVKITLFQALCKGEKFETIVQKSVELGVSEIVPVLTERCVSRPDEKSFVRKRERYGRIALEAAKQCGRGKIPAIGLLQNLTDVSGLINDFDIVLFFYERSTCPFRSIALEGKRNIAMIVGAEGGFSDEEAAMLERAGAISASLGNRILRCETAPIAALGALMYAVGEL